MRLLLTALLVLLPFGAQAPAQAETLADIRAQLGQLSAELAGLRQELVSTGAVAQAGGATMLERMEMIELEMMRLTGRTEDLEIRLNRVVNEGSIRLDDLEFRLVELEGGDVSALVPRGALGAEPAAPAVAVPMAPVASGEQADFDRAREVLGQGDFRTAEGLLAAHAAAFPGSALRGEVLFLRGEALEGLGDVAGAARSFLESFSGAPDGPRAADALHRLGRALAVLGQVQEACLTLAETEARYPGQTGAEAARAERVALACP